MAHRLPPFSAMRTFEVAARHCSFKQAAAELTRTPSAVSHQIKALEEYLGVRLFTRLDRGLELTDAGRDYLVSLREAFDRLEAATNRVGGDESRGILTVNMFPTFALTWLIRRLGSFNRANPDIEVRLISSTNPIDFASTDIDVAVRYGDGNWPGLHCDYLMEELIFPVCSPACMAAGTTETGAVALSELTLINCMEQPQEWHLWLAAAGVHDLDPGLGLHFDSRILALEAAISGLGIAIGCRPFVDDDLATGRLVAPFEFELDSGSAYYLACPEVKSDLPKIVNFRTWLLAECSRHRTA